MVMFYPAILRLVDGDAKAALFLCAIVHLLHEQGDGLDQAVKRPLDTIERLTGLSSKEQRRARDKLSAFGTITFQRYGSPPTYEYRVADPRVASSITESAKVPIGNDALWAPNGGSASYLLSREVIEPQESQRAPISKNNGLRDSIPAQRAPLTFASVLSGDVDKAPRLLSCPPEIIDALLNGWCEAWGKDRARTKATAARLKAFRAAVRDHRTPSDFARAIIGMTHDDWPERRKHNDWTLVHRSIERWLGLYDEHAGTARDHTVRTRRVKARNWSFVEVPTDYEWTDADDFMVERGFTFNLTTRQWQEVA